jgi:hypothetical protein
MRKATIYYNRLPHPMENDYWNKKYNDVHFSEKDTVTLKIGFFRHYWRKMPIKEEVDTLNLNESLEKIFAKYNQYDKNPYSSENNGQHIIKEKDVLHTSMMVGDVIKVKDYYIVASVGFKKLILR